MKINKLALAYIMTFIGSLICTIGINAFYIPHHLLSGGIGGIAIMLFYLINVPIGVAMFVLNIPIMIACYKFMGRKYTVLSIVGTIMFSVLVDATSFLADFNYIHDPIISTVMGSILNGIGMGLTYRYNGNAGGLDVVAAIIKKFYSLEMGSAVMGINVFIITCAAIMFNLELAVLTFVGTYISAVVTNKVVIGINQRKTVMIISNHTDEIAEVVIRYLGRGGTIFYGQGAYTHQEKKVLYVIISLTQVSRVKDMIEKIDPKAFMVIGDVSEVIGKGYTKPFTRHYYRYIDDDSMAMPRTKKSFPPEV